MPDCVVFGSQIMSPNLIHFVWRYIMSGVAEVRKRAREGGREGGREGERK